MIIAVVSAVALLASALTFFSGFGLGTLLLPAFVLFFPVEASWLTFISIDGTEACAGARGSDVQARQRIRSQVAVA